ncbi:MGH1-like glycoside hydrolase domain-containing protein [Terracidiphilus gabretensis]|uniref:MGH1-like glycoside hydrolase domain-containing protein n=1 Tax=Terracidiphilus gabretensis TaxID=1577687 RepID=UPI0018D1FBF8|nr:discoidin domain-containing protein [Terracidiphilus gabretensis]
MISTASIRKALFHSMPQHILLFCLLACIPLLHTQAQPKSANYSLPKQQLAAKYFGADAPWFLDNIPFLEIDDPEIQQIYYYRWKLYRSHIREIGPQGAMVTEFLDNVPWGRQPYTDLNDSSSFHLLEGRWMRNPAVINSLIDHLYSGGGNDRHFSESIAAATWSTTLVTGDPQPAIRHLDTMQYIFNEWDDHLDSTRSLYWIDPISDATEYSIASIDASGAGFTDHPSTDERQNGFLFGSAFRPSINSYQFANANAIAEIASAAGRHDIADEYQQRAEKIRSAMLSQLWNPDLEHFTDRYQRSTSSVKAGEFIRGRELVGYVPWLYELPLKDASATETAKAWRHILSPSELAGPYGLRTAEPSYAKYMVQYRYDRPTGNPECQWNGPSWPFQTSQALGGLANLLNDYHQNIITSGDYLRLLRQYTHQHFLSPDHPDLQEDYNPDTGRPIVGLPRSHHYNHSTYIDLILSGLVGIRPRVDNVLELNPLIPSDEDSAGRPIRYFLLDNLIYHGHAVTIIYDQTGAHYHATRGLSVIVDGKLAARSSSLKRIQVLLSSPRNVISHQPRNPIDLAVNPGISEPPSATASSSGTTGSPSQAIDGRLWFFPEIAKGWSPASDTAGKQSWLSIDFGHVHEVNTVDLYFLGDAPDYQAPAGAALEYQVGQEWRPIPGQLHELGKHPISNGRNRITFSAVQTQAIRVIVDGPPAPATFRLIEAEVFDLK